MDNHKTERINWRIVSSNVKESNDELNKLLMRISESQKPNRADLEISIRHAMQHLNTA